MAKDSLSSQSDSELSGKQEDLKRILSQSINSYSLEKANESVNLTPKSSSQSIVSSQ